MGALETVDDGGNVSYAVEVEHIYNSPRKTAISTDSKLREIVKEQNDGRMQLHMHIT